MTVLCHRCGKEFPAQWRLGRHLNRKKPCIKPSQKTTKTSQKNTTSSQKTTKTSQNIRYSCEYCNRSYKHNWHLTRHIKTCKDRISIMEFLLLSFLQFLVFLFQEQKLDLKHLYLLTNIEDCFLLFFLFFLLFYQYLVFEIHRSE